MQVTGDAMNISGQYTIACYFFFVFSERETHDRNIQPLRPCIVVPNG